MGEKGARASEQAAALAQKLVGRLAPIGELASRPMFGGFGIYAEGRMFGIVSSDAEVFLKANDASRELFESAGSHRHGKMPYFSVPDRVLRNTATLRRWARRAVEAAGTRPAPRRPRKR